MFRGSYTALITPMRDGAIDEAAFLNFVNWQVEQGTQGLVPVGTTGEAPTLTEHEKLRLITLCVEVSAGRVPVIAGVGSNSTAGTISFAKKAEEAGASGLLIACPYYNRPSQEGLYQHFKEIACSVALPQFLYNVPGRTAVDMSVETMARLKEFPNIVGIKDATGDLERVSRQRQIMGAEFVQFSGEDGTALGFCAQGGHGCISVTANVAPALCAEFQEACFRKDYEKALVLHDRLFPLHRVLFLDTNPIPVKYAVSLLGLCTPELRLPLVPTGSLVQEEIREVLDSMGLTGN